MTTDAIARLKITLDDVKPVVSRRIEAPLALRLDRLHHVLQIVVGWTNSHLYEFRKAAASKVLTATCRCCRVLAHAGRQGRCVVSAFIATAFA